MSSKHRHGLPRKKPGLNARDEIEGDLPVLQPVDDDLSVLQPVDGEDLPVLEAVEAEEPETGPIKVQCAPADEAAFDSVLTFDVPAMDKKAVAEAIAGPLQRAMTRHKAMLRYKKVLVRFTGEGIVGSAVRDQVGTALAAQKVLLGMVRRGFGDETVATGALPTVTMTRADADRTTTLTVATGDVAAEDLALVLAPHLADAAKGAKGKRYVWQFQGGAKPDAALRDAIGKALQDAGAASAAIGARVLFDRELLDRVKVTVAGDTATVEIDPAEESAVTLDALSAVLPGAAPQFAGKVVRLRGKRALRADEQRLALDLCGRGAPQRIEAVGAAGKAEVLWPPVVACVAGPEMVLRVNANGRDPAATIAAFANELPGHVVPCKGKAVVVDWPAGTAVTGAVEDAVREAIKVLQPKALAATVAGEQREPFWPEPLAFAKADGKVTLGIDTDVARPPDLARGIERKLAAVRAELRGAAVRVALKGQSAPSRSLLRTVCSAIEAAGAMQLEIEDHGTVDVLLPPMLTITKTGADGVRIAAVAGPRNEAQQALALKRELDVAGLPENAVVTVLPSAASEAVVAAAIARGAARVAIDGPAPVQVHPPLLGKPQKKGTNVRLAVQPGGDAAMVGRQLDRELPAAIAGAGLLANASVTIEWPGAAADSPPVAAIVAAFADKKAARVLLENGQDKPLQLHPKPTPPTVVPFAKPEAPAAAPAAAAPVAAAAAKAPVAPAGPAAELTGGPSVLSILARKDEGVPPVLVLGVEAGADEAHLARVAAQLQQHLPKFRGRCVMLVLRRDGQDVPVRREEPLVATLRQLVPTTAAATLVFRGPDAQGRPHFQVIASSLRAMPVGAVFGDPRR